MLADLRDAPPAMSLRSRRPARPVQAAAGKGDSSRHPPGAAGGQQAGLGGQQAGGRRAANAPAIAADGGRMQSLGALEQAKVTSRRAAAAPGGVPSGSAAVFGDAMGYAAAQQAQGGVRGQSPAPSVEAAQSESACLRHSQSSAGQASGPSSGTSMAGMSGEQAGLHITLWVYVVPGDFGTGRAPLSCQPCESSGSLKLHIVRDQPAQASASCCAILSLHECLHGCRSGTGEPCPAPGTSAGYQRPSPCPISDGSPQEVCMLPCGTLAQPWCLDLQPTVMRGAVWPWSLPPTPVQRGQEEGYCRDSCSPASTVCKCLRQRCLQAPVPGGVLTLPEGSPPETSVSQLRFVQGTATR